MTRNRILALALGAALITSGDALAYKYVGPNGPGAAGPNATGETNGTLGAAQPRSVAAACAPAAALKNLEWNNVRALVETGGSLWQNRAQGNAAYEIPKDGNTHSIYAGSLVDGWHLPRPATQARRHQVPRLRQRLLAWPADQ